MLWLAALAATAAQPLPPKPAVIPSLQAKASVRIVRAMPIRFQEIERQAPAALRRTVVRTSDGELREARLLEFQ